MSGYSLVGPAGNSTCYNQYVKNTGVVYNVPDLDSCQNKCNLDKECTGFDYEAGLFGGLSTCKMWNVNILTRNYTFNLFNVKSCYRRNVKTPLTAFANSLYVNTLSADCFNDIASVTDNSTVTYTSIYSFPPSSCQAYCSIDPTCTGSQFERIPSTFFGTLYRCINLRRQITKTVTGKNVANTCDRRILKTSSLATCDAGMKAYNTISFTLNTGVTESMCASECLNNPLCKGVSYTIPASGTSVICSFHYSNIMGVIPWVSSPIAPPRVQSCMAVVPLQ